MLSTLEPESSFIAFNLNPTFELAPLQLLDPSLKAPGFKTSTRRREKLAFNLKPDFLSLAPLQLGESASAIGYSIIVATVVIIGRAVGAI